MKKYTKRLATAITLITTLLLCACGNTTTSEKSLYEHGLDVISLMTEITRNEQYLSVYTASKDITDIATTISQGDFSTPKAVYALTFSDTQLENLAEIESMGNISPELKEMIKTRTISTLITQINGLAGVAQLATTSVCNAGKSFVEPSVNENSIYIYTYENATPIAVTFTIGDDHIVDATGQFILWDQFTCNSAEEIENFFSGMLMDVKAVPVN